MPRVQVPSSKREAENQSLMLILDWSVRFSPDRSCQSREVVFLKVYYVVKFRCVFELLCAVSCAAACLLLPAEHADSTENKQGKPTQQSAAAVVGESDIRSNV